MSEKTKKDVLRCRQAIREHRDAKLDDRCWVDDYAVWATVDGTTADLSTPPPYEEAMKECLSFYAGRRSEHPDPPVPNSTPRPALWDQDLLGMTEAALQEEYSRIRLAICGHFDKKGSLTIDDDRALYNILPEKLPADFRLPRTAEFLGEEKAPHAGCPSFWRSHAQCRSSGHNLHRWGPCGTQRE